MTHSTNSPCPADSDLRGDLEQHGGRDPEPGVPGHLPQQPGLHLEDRLAHWLR